MVDRARVESFVDVVVSGDHVRAIAEFYREDASMQENAAEPRRGRELLMAQETAFLSKAARVFTHPPRALLVDGDRVAIQWVFDITDRSGVTRRREEVALQTWRGDRIAEERFFYDTGSTDREVTAA
jgi:ketosteroid isomerase-like protein